MSVFREKFLDMVAQALLKHGVPDMDHDVFLALMNTPMGQQPAVVTLLAMKNPLLGEPPLTVANVAPVAVVDSAHMEQAVGEMVEHLNKNRAALMESPPVPLRS